MIKKIDIPKSTVIDASVLWGGINDNVLAAKINEVIDAVNELQEFADVADKNLAKLMEEATSAENAQPDTETLPKNVQDKFAEQRKWIGKLCRFYDDDAFITSNDWAFGVLTSIDKGMRYQYCCNENCNFKHCEPVSPDDDIIYKGER